MLVNKHTYVTVRIPKTDELKALEKKTQQEMETIRAYKSKQVGPLAFWDFIIMTVIVIVFGIPATPLTMAVIPPAVIAFNLIVFFKAQKKFKADVEKFNLEIDENLHSLTEKILSARLYEMFEQEIRAEKLGECDMMKHTLNTHPDHYDITVKC